MSGFIINYLLLPLHTPLWPLLSQQPQRDSEWKYQSRAQLLARINPEWPFSILCMWSFIGDLASDDEYLEIPSISRQRAGTYECTAVNDIDADVQTVDITVNCESAAEWVYQ